MDDKEILEKIRLPETRDYGFNMLIRAYQQRVYTHIRRMVIDHDDADDLTQEVFIKIYKNIDSFREHAQLFTWIYRIATNESLTFLQRQKRRYLLPLKDVTRELSQKVDNSTLLSGDEIQRRLQKAILTLPEKQRLVFHMRYFDELSYEDISRITDTSVGALKASYHLAVKKIEKYLAAH